MVMDTLYHGKDNAGMLYSPPLQRFHFQECNSPPKSAGTTKETCRYHVGMPLYNVVLNYWLESATSYVCSVCVACMIKQDIQDPNVSCMLLK